MQLLYAQRQDPALTRSKAVEAFRHSIDTSYHNLLFDLYLFTRIAHESRLEKKRKQVRIQPSEEDKVFKSHFYDNPLLLNLANNAALLKEAERLKFQSLLEDAPLRALYEHARSIEGYDAYAIQEAPSNKEHLDILLRTHKKLIDTELFNDLIEDHFAQWGEDKSLVVGSVKKVLKSLPQEDNFLQEYRTDHATSVDFGEHLLCYVLDEDQTLLGQIEPVLTNWDTERVAILDMVLIKMALSELLELKQIPPKVTLNEYIELAKTYSTDRSKEFVNGVLDKLLSTLRENGLIAKEGRGLIE